MSELAQDGRPALLLLLGQLKREARELEERLGLSSEAPIPQLPAGVESRMHRLIAESSADLLSVHAPNGDYVFVGAHCEAFFGWKAEQLLGHSAYEFFHPADLERIAADHAKHFEPAEAPQVQYRIRCASGRYRWVETRSCSTGNPGYLVCITRDIHAETLSNRRLLRLQKALKREMKGHAYTDALTELPNRRALDEALQRHIQRGRRNGKPVAVALFDVDSFKAINDRWGHQEGDAVLGEVGRRIASQARDEDLAGRWGGDEFLVILPETGLREARRYAERVRGAVAKLRFPGCGKVTLSGGLTSARYPCMDDQLLREADLALLRAKERGRNRIEGAGPTRRA